jgi:hypothetical protein
MENLLACIIEDPKIRLELLLQFFDPMKTPAKFIDFFKVCDR